MRRATLLSRAFVGDMNWAKASQHPYAIGLTWEPLWSRIPWVVKIWAISVHFDHLQSPYNGQHCSVGLLWEIWIESCPPNTPMLLVWPENHFGVSYLEWWKFEQFRLILIIFKVHLMGNTAQLDFCGRYELSHVPLTPLCYRFDLGTTLKWYTLRRW